MITRELNKIVYTMMHYSIIITYWITYWILGSDNKHKLVAPILLPYLYVTYKNMGIIKTCAALDSATNQSQT